MGDLPNGMIEVIPVWDCHCHYMEYKRPQISGVAKWQDFRKAKAEMDKQPRRHICDRHFHGLKPFEIPPEFVSAARGCLYVCPIRQNIYRDALQKFPTDDATRQEMQTYIDAEVNVPENPEKTCVLVTVHKVGI